MLIHKIVRGMHADVEEEDIYYSLNMGRGGGLDSRSLDLSLHPPFRTERCLLATSECDVPLALVRKQGTP